MKNDLTKVVIITIIGAIVYAQYAHWQCLSGQFVKKKESRIKIEEVRSYREF